MPLLTSPASLQGSVQILVESPFFVLPRRPRRCARRVVALERPVVFAYGVVMGSTIAEKILPGLSGPLGTLATGAGSADLATVIALGEVWRRVPASRPLALRAVRGALAPSEEVVGARGAL